MYRRLPGNVLILLICLTLAISYLLTIHIFPSSSFPQYLNRPPVTVGVTPTSIIHFQDQNYICSTTTLSLTTTSPCSCPSPTPESQTKPQPLINEPTLEQEIIDRLRTAGIVIIFKTGAQEVSQLAIQLGTTLRYLSSSDILFFSDLQGSLGPFIINDALRNVDQSLKRNDPDFEIYRAIQRYQSTGQDIEELKEERSKGDGRSGWRLDKYKFLHMVEETFEERPDAKWYVFIETDSYVFWDNLASFLSRFDSTKPMYLGSSVTLGGISFAHGGSGYVLSNAAMNKLLGPEQPQGLAASWDTRMEGFCCGDLALGTALHEKGVFITVAHPLLNGYKPTTFTYGPNNHWCQPVVTMHHVLPHEISAIWRYERRREMLTERPNATIFAELYAHFVEPHLADSRDNWDNLSHGPTFTESSAQLIQNQEKEDKMMGEDERKKTDEAKAKSEKVPPKSADKQKEVKKGHNKPSGESKDEKPVEKGKEKEESKLTSADNKTIDEGEKNESKLDKQSNAKAKMGDTLPIGEDTKTKGKGSKTVLENKEKPLPGKSNKRRDGISKMRDLEKVAWQSFENCQKMCLERLDCFQYVVYEKTCKLGLSFRLGKHVAPDSDGKVVWKSGWMVDRIRKWTEVNACHGPEWPDIR